MQFVSNQQLKKLHDLQGRVNSKCATAPAQSEGEFVRRVGDSRCVDTNAAERIRTRRRVVAIDGKKSPRDVRTITRASRLIDWLRPPAFGSRLWAAGVYLSARS